MKSEKEITNLLKDTFLSGTFSVSFLAEGFGNFNYLIKDAGEKYVLRLKKSDESQFLDSLEKEYVFLKYFESKGIDFCPKVLLYDKEQNFLIESYLDGQKISQVNFSDEQIDELACNLKKIFELDVSSFYDFCIQNDYKEFKYVDPLTSLNTYGFNRYEEAKKGDLSKEVTAWFEETLDGNLSFLSNLQKDDDDLGFSWGDIQSEVIVDSKGKMNLYDFEHVSISNSFGLTYIKIHSKFNSSQFNYLLDRCAHHFNRDKKDLILDMNREERVIRTNDAVWAAMMWSKTKDKKFEALMYKRIELVNNID